MKPIFLFIFCLFAFTIYSQKPNKIEIDLSKAKERVLLVEIPVIDTKYLDKLKEKTTEINEYTERYNQFISNYKNAFIKYWKTNKEILFKTNEEINQIIESETDKYVIIRYIENLGPLSSHMSINDKNSKYTFVDKNNSKYITERKWESKNAVINLYLSENPKYTLTAVLPATESLGSLIILIKQFNNTFDFFVNHPNFKHEQPNIYMYKMYEFEKRISELTTTTLYIKKEDLDKSVNIDKISTIYPYKYKIVTNEEWEKAVIDENKNISLFLLEPGFGNSLGFFHYAISASNAMPQVVYLLNYGGADDTFKYFTKMINTIEKKSKK